MSKITVLAGLVSPEASLLGLQMATLSLSSHVLSSLHAFLESLCVSQISSSNKDPSHIALGPTLKLKLGPHLNLITSLMALSPNRVTF